MPIWVGGIQNKQQAFVALSAYCWFKVEGLEWALNLSVRDLGRCRVLPVRVQGVGEEGERSGTTPMMDRPPLGT